MKAVITQITGRKAVLLTQDGTFVRAVNRGYRIGQQISTGQRRSRALRPLFVAACLAAVLLSATAYAAYTLPFSYISVDVNPSLQMTLNWFDRVHTVEAVNEDAQDIVRRLLEEDIINQPVGNAMQMIYSALEEDAYFADTDANDVVVAVASYGIKDIVPIARQIEQIQTIKNSGIVLNVRTIEVEQAALNEAKEYQTTAGKLILVRALANGSPEETRAWLRRSVREILDALQGNTGAEIIVQPDSAQQPTASSEPTQTPAPDSKGSDAKPGGGSTHAPQQTPTAGKPDAGQGGNDVQSDDAPQGTAETPIATPKNTQAEPGTEGGGGHAQSNAPQQPSGNGRGPSN